MGNALVPVSASKANREFQGQYGTQIELLLAATVICIIPLVILFVFLQRHLVRGIHLGGGVKG